MSLPSAMRGLGVAVSIGLVGGLGLAGAPAHAEDCASRLPAAALDARIDQAEAAWTALDLEGFRRAADDLSGALPCLQGPLDVDQAARVHRLQGMRAFVQNDTERAELAFAAARRLRPGEGLPAALAPAQHPIRKHFSALPIDDVGDTALDARFAWQVDGREAELRPSRMPTVVQQRTADGAVSRSWYLWPGEAPLVAAPTGGIGRWLALGGGVALAAAGGTYLGAVATERRYWSSDTPRSELDGLRSRTNGLVWTSAALGAVGLGLGGATLAVDW